MINFEDLVGRKIFIILKSNHVYTGEVLDIDGTLIRIRDKFNEYVTFDRTEIKVMKELE